MKAVDLYAAALVAGSRGFEPATIAGDAQALAEAVCIVSGHNWADHAYVCDRCGEAEPREVVVSEGSKDR